MDGGGPLTERFRAVVVGSGFGGSVVADELARAGWPVLVLERGRPYPPGSFPRTPRALAGALWAPEQGRHGMFDLFSFTGLNAVVASGLGGGSLIYANVLLRKDPGSFAHEDGTPWPVTYDDLDDHYRAVEDVLRPVPYPEAYDARTPKTRAMLRAAEALGRDWERSPLAVAFATADGADPVPGAPLPEDRDNLHGLPRTTCRLLGECDLGCQVGAKQTLDHTYLSRAHAAGATIRVLSEATVIRPLDEGGYAVTYRQHLHARDGVDERLLDEPAPAATVTVHADHVVLAAGTLGTARLLLRNRATLPRLGGRLGEGFSGNGDLLTFAWDADQRLDMATGPVITGTLRWTDDESPSGRMFQLQDAGVPAIAEWLFGAFDVPATAWAGRRWLLRTLRDRLRGDRDTAIGDDLAELLERAAVSSESLPLLGMGRDLPGGRLFLDGDDLDCDWDQAASEHVFDAIRQASAAVAGALGARFREVPFARLITVHPLGGCAMADGPWGGVVDRWGESFGHPGLHVADGSVLPGPVGPNPSLTIAALARRTAAHLAGTA